jgi:hypothetical protein
MTSTTPTSGTRTNEVTPSRQSSLTQQRPSLTTPSQVKRQEAQEEEDDDEEEEEEEDDDEDEEEEIEEEEDEEEDEEEGTNDQDDEEEEETDDDEEEGVGYEKIATPPSRLPVTPAKYQYYANRRNDYLNSIPDSPPPKETTTASVTTTPSSASSFARRDSKESPSSRKTPAAVVSTSNASSSNTSSSLRSSHGNYNLTNNQGSGQPTTPSSTTSACRSSFTNTASDAEPPFARKYVSSVRESDKLDKTRDKPREPLSRSNTRPSSYRTTRLGDDDDDEDLVFRRGISRNDYDEVEDDNAFDDEHEGDADVTALLTRAARVRREFASGSSNSSLSSDTNLVGRRRGGSLRDRLSSRSSTIDHGSPVTFRSEYAKRKEEYGEDDKTGRSTSLTRSQTDKLSDPLMKSRKSGGGRESFLTRRRTLDVIDGQSHAVTPSSSSLMSPASKSVKTTNASNTTTREKSDLKGISQNISQTIPSDSSRLTSSSFNVLSPNSVSDTLKAADITATPVNSVSHYEDMLERDCSVVLSAPSTVHTFKVTPNSLDIKLPPMKYKAPRSASLQRTPVDDSKEGKSTPLAPARKTSLPVKPSEMSPLERQKLLSRRPVFVECVATPDIPTVTSVSDPEPQKKSPYSKRKTSTGSTSSLSRGKPLAIVPESKTLSVSPTPSTTSSSFKGFFASALSLPKSLISIPSSLLSLSSSGNVSSSNDTPASSARNRRKK